jgi:hypothetical protein
VGDEAPAGYQQAAAAPRIDGALLAGMCPVIFVGVDPGKQGAIAVLDDAGRALETLPTPIVSASGGARPEYDLPAIRDYIDRWRKVGSIGGGAFVTVEKGQPMPPTVPGGSAANFARGVARGWEWMLVALRLPYQLVAPRTWQLVMHAGTPGSDTKQRSMLAAHRLFPGVSLTRSMRCRNESDGIAEALLIAEFGRRSRGSATRNPDNHEPRYRERSDAQTIC